MTKLSPKVSILLSITAVCVALVFLTAYSKYIFAKDYDFILEAPCNPEIEVCFVRDCDDYCPPNELDTYTIYKIPASAYESCTTNSCQNICQNPKTSGLCEKINCQIEDGDDCSDTQ